MPRTRGSKDKPEIVWVPGMKLGEGAPLDRSFWSRVEPELRGTGDGTVANPKVSYTCNQVSFPYKVNCLIPR